MSPRWGSTRRLPAWLTDWTSVAVWLWLWLWPRTRVEAGSNTSTVSLRVVGGDENGSLESETVKYCRESQRARTQERQRCQGPAACADDKPVLSSQRAFHKNKTVPHLGLDTKAYWLTDWLTDRPTVSRNVTWTWTVAYKYLVMSPRWGSTSRLTDRLTVSRNVTSACLLVPRVEAGVEYLHRSPASRRRRRKGNPVPGSITGPPCSGGYKYGDLALWVGESRISDSKIWSRVPPGLGPENDCAGEDQQQL
jgi:hypothetical protein